MIDDNILQIRKDMFIGIKKENINNYYEVVAKVPLFRSRNSEREHLELYTREESRMPRVRGEPSKKFLKQPSKIQKCY